MTAIIDPMSGAPHVGTYRARLVKGGPVVPVALCWCCPWVDPSFDADPEDWCRPLDRGPRLRWYVTGREATLPDGWFPLTGDPITLAEYLYQVSVAQWDQAYAPKAPMANPRKRINLMDVGVPF